MVIIVFLLLLKRSKNTELKIIGEFQWHLQGLEKEVPKFYILKAKVQYHS